MSKKSEAEIKYTGILKTVNKLSVNFRVSIAINDRNQTIVTAFEVTESVVKEIRDSEYCCGIVALDQGGYLSLFDLFIEQEKRQLIARGEKENNITIELLTTNAIRGATEFEEEDEFNEFQLEITDGCELIGLCPYDINQNYMKLQKYESVDIPLNYPPVLANTFLGEFHFSCFPDIEFTKNGLTMKMRHNIYFKSCRMLTVKDFHPLFSKLTDFFSILCGELVTINKLTLYKEMGQRGEEYEFIGYTNFPRYKLYLLEGNGVDATSYLRIALFKVSDFPNLSEALNWWFEHGDKLEQAQNSYGRILLDEDVKIVTENKFLAAMQLIEGYEAGIGVENENGKKAEFEAQKERLITRLEKDDKCFAQKYLTYMGETFRKRVRIYMYEGVNHFIDISKTEFCKKYDELIGKIVNERDLYTHGVVQAEPTCNILEIERIADICKDFYRSFLLQKMGISPEVLKWRFSHNRAFVAYLKNIFDIDIERDGKLFGFDKEMWHFSNG